MIGLSSQTRLSLPLFTKQKDASFAVWPEVHNLFLTSISLSLQIMYFSTKRACLSVCSAQRLLRFVLRSDVFLMLDLAHILHAGQPNELMQSGATGMARNKAILYIQPQTYVHA